MKHSKLILTLATLGLVTMGCAKEFKTTENGQVVTTGVVNPTFPVTAPPGQGAGSAGDSWTYGSSAPFTPDSLAIMSTYVGRSVSSPTNFQINVNVFDVGGGHYGGQIKMAYDDQGVHHEGYFAAGTGLNQNFPSNGTANDVGLFQSQYNTWLNDKTFSGYFQDTLGAIVLVVDDTGPSLGDGQGTTTVSGSIWFKNFTAAIPPQGFERYCWFITRGPYQCASNFVNVKLVPYPMDGYQRLGTFTTLTKAKAFNQ